MNAPRRRLRAGVAALALVVLTSTLVACVRNPGPNPTGGDWLHTRGNQIVDVNGDPVWLTGANWFGFNTSERVFHGLWQGNLEGITRSMAERGINIVRVPVSTQLLLEWKDGTTITPNVNLSVNPDLAGLDNLEVFDRFLALAQRYGLKVMLDVHSAEADNAGHIYPVWFKGAITTERFYEGWEWVTARYRTNDTVVAMDIKNEPHGGAGQSPRAKWDGSTDPDNWKHVCQTAGRRILAINPNVLILCEGVEIYPRDGSSWGGGEFDTTWWGANLRGVRDHPVDLGAQQDQLVYSPHDYGPSVFAQPWFNGNWDKATLTRDAWDPNWLFIHRQQIAPVLIGEWGGFMDGGANQRWMTALRDLIVEHRLHHTFWAVNPNSGDTGGLLTDDWATWDEAKYGLLRPALWQHQGRFVSLDHEVPLGNATVGTTVTEVYR